MNVSPGDILTALKNIVTALNNEAQTYLNVAGAQNLAAFTGTQLVKNSAGRVAVISVTTAGSTTGLVYDCNTLTTLSKPIFVIPQAVGVYPVNLPCNFGIVVATGTSQVVTVSFS